MKLNRKQRKMLIRICIAAVMLVLVNIISLDRPSIDIIKQG